MKRGSEEANAPSTHTFSLQPTLPSKDRLSLLCDFAPLRCRKTNQLFSTIPTYRPNQLDPFHTEADLPRCSLRLLPEDHPPKQILAPKPRSQYCQVCREHFDDYRKHIEHPIHLRKLRDNRVCKDIDSLKDLLLRSQRKQRDFASTTALAHPRRTPDDDSDSLSEGTQQPEGLLPSKKRIVEGADGEMEVISLVGSTHCIEEELPVERKTRRKYSNCREDMF